MLPDSFAVKAIALVITVKPANLGKKIFLKIKDKFISTISWFSKRKMGGY